MAEEEISSNRGGNPKYTWDDFVAAVGKDFSGGNELVSDEVIEYSSVMRFCEPWEIGNPIYWSKQAANRLGYRGTVTPWSAIRLTFSTAGRWKPGDETHFPTPEPNASGPMHTFSEGGEELPMPPYAYSIATNMKIEFFEPACVGDRLTARGEKLVNVVLKRTRVGFGAFHTRERRIYNQRGELVARVSSTSYSYNREQRG